MVRLREVSSGYLLNLSVDKIAKREEWYIIQGYVIIRADGVHVHDIADIVRALTSGYACDVTSTRVVGNVL
jgi:hypothetical protein